MATSCTVSERLASWVVGLDYGDLPADVIAMTKRLVLDQLGLQLRGSTDRKSTRLNSSHATLSRMPSSA